jgi:hypothetical protein
VKVIKKFKTKLSAGQTMISVLLGQKNVFLLIFFHLHNERAVRSDVHQANRKKRPGKLSKMVILPHDNHLPHAENLTKATLATLATMLRKS